MREVLSPIDHLVVRSGGNHVEPMRKSGVQVGAHLTVYGVPLTAWAFMTGDPQVRRYNRRAYDTDRDLVY